jgi:hypothetical protein
MEAPDIRGSMSSKTVRQWVRAGARIEPLLEASAAEIETSRTIPGRADALHDTRDVPHGGAARWAGGLDPARNQNGCSDRRATPVLPGVLRAAAPRWLAHTWSRASRGRSSASARGVYVQLHQGRAAVPGGSADGGWRINGTWTFSGNGLLPGGGHCRCATRKATNQHPDGRPVGVR